MKFTAVGRIHPERTAVYIDTIRWQKESSTLTFRCDASQISIQVDDDRINNLISAHGTAEHIAQNFASTLGFLLGCSYRAEITQIIPEEHHPFTFGVQREELKFSFSEEDFNAAFSELINLVRHDMPLRFSIQDYTQAINDKLGCAMYCYRAIESIAKSIGGNTRKGNTNWPPLHETLNTSAEEMTSKVTSFAKIVRHGNWNEFKSTNEQQRLDMLLLTREIICRYIDHLKK
jgi:hypothetical protein